MVTELAKINSFSRDLFDASREASAPKWLQSLRQNAFNRFEEAGFPSVHEEEWKYTHVAPIARAEFLFNESPQVSEIDIAPFLYPEARDARLVFVNGQLNSDLSSLSGLDPAVVVKEFNKAISD